MMIPSGLANSAWNSLGVVEIKPCPQCSSIYAVPEKKDWLYSAKRHQQMVPATYF